MVGSWSWLSRDVVKIFVVAAVLFLTYGLMKAVELYRKRQELLKVLKNFPGPPTHWLYSHLKLLKPEEELNNMASWTGKYLHCIPLWFGPFFALLNIHHPDYAKVLLSRGDPKSHLPYSFLIPWIGKGLLILDGPKWFHHQKLLTPGFHYNILKPYVNLMVDSVRVMLDKWEQQATPKMSMEIFHSISLMTLDTILKCAFSYESNCQMDSGSSYIRSILDISTSIYQRFRIPLHHNATLYWLSAQGRHFRKACTLTHDHTDKVIRERKEALKDEQVLSKILKKRCLDFLDILLCAKDENGNGLSDEDLHAEVDTFMFAGHDTTASGIFWLFYCLALYPEHQQRCREEIQEILGDQETIQWEDLGKMTYSTMCIKESLRLFPAAPATIRELTSPLLFDDGRTLPKGFMVFMNIYSLHRNPSVWDNPEVVHFRCYLRQRSIVDAVMTRKYIERQEA
ncbi:cytochrome P450 4A5-like [Alligator sinensis]|uniref:Cytochrome P450 4A5-like n=1 Tax=Alligator sinensis TaxID=38654 RepID=A0A1U7R9D7_ALLSI|nr:cytochrome P450 4A5-like [Alligator sinensis]